ncbi:dehydrogenase with different specificitie [Byssothecium circinans]|uniref:Dehydrogenase with different specificitie n=1 Tax=Byssothecium circinans TaxID=147558 RepID=A0A6A5TN27_9PLEO|nr:dehydrogenase with different specificitie [Byssothecium circinans]
MGLNTSYDPDKDIPDLSGKVIFMTGGTAGLGKETIATLAKHNPQHIVFTGRNAEAAKAVVSETKTTSPSVKVSFIECDQTSLASVKSASTQLLELVDRLDIFIANAGIMGGDPGVSKDGHEIQFAVNYLSHALFVKLLLPVLERTASTENNVRIILLSSVGFRFTPAGGIVFKDLKSEQTNLPIGIMQAKWLRYGQSKLAMVLHAQDLAERHPLVTTLCLHPGAISTGLIEDKPMFDRWFLKLATFGQRVPLNQGVWNTCWAATAPAGDQLKSGDMYEPVGVPMKGTKDSESAKLREQLREWTEKELERYSHE